MRENNSSNYLFYEKFVREFCENVRNVDFFDINRMYTGLTNDMKNIFLGTLSICENEAFLFEITKMKLLNILQKVLIDVHKAKPNQIKDLQNFFNERI